MPNLSVVDRLTKCCLQVSHEVALLARVLEFSALEANHMLAERARRKPKLGTACRQRQVVVFTGVFYFASKAVCQHMRAAHL